MKSTLYRQLEHYCSFGPYPFHMPGHKRNLMPVDGLPYDWDLTEVAGTDDLHEAEGILKQAMDRTRDLFGVGRTWYLVGGSTCGLLSGIRALAPAGSRIIAARNCHKSVCNAIELGNLQVSWLMPPVLKSGACGSISPQMVLEAVEKTTDAACVVITSPTYEGVISDIQGIAAVCHEKKIPLLVDEAHGSHLGFSPDWPESARHLGADVIVESVHKTLPSLTQTALLHLGKNSLADPEEMERQLAVFETSSPSYPLLASIDGCTELLMTEGAVLFAQWKARLDLFREKMKGLIHLSLLDSSAEADIFDFDPSKLAVVTHRTNLTGKKLGEILRSRYGLETEMCQGDICLAMTGMGDSDRAMASLAEALLEIDSHLTVSERETVRTLPQPGKASLPAGEAILQQKETVRREEAAGRISGEYIWAYPPGIPLILPGEEITARQLSDLRGLEAAGTALHHSMCRENGKISVLTAL